ncbi:hypothetical protein GCM10010168_50400 [Actinoplanes ianthinogenes]|nr:hypothetical protein GCM10010168_50400 [Actinoplanes ianthinogenes]
MHGSAAGRVCPGSGARHRTYACDTLRAQLAQIATIDLRRVNAGHARTLPLPSTYVDDRGGIIR